MNRTALKRQLLLFSLGLILLSLPNRVPAQLSSKDEERLQILSDPEALKKKMEKDKTRAPFEFFRSQVAPFDVLPFVKPHHWCTLTLEVRANYEDYEGSLQSFPVMLAGMPQEMVYAREARLVKEQRARLGMQVMLPAHPQGEGAQPRAASSPGRSATTSSGRPREAAAAASDAGRGPEQGLDQPVSRPGTGCRAIRSRRRRSARTRRAVELQRYYRLVLPLEARQAVPLAPPADLGADQPHHLGRAAARLAPGLASASDARLAALGRADRPHRRGRAHVLDLPRQLPRRLLAGRPDGRERAVERGRPAAAVSQSYPPPVLAARGSVTEIAGRSRGRPRRPSGMYGRPYRAPVPIRPPANRPVFLAGLRPRPGAATIPLGEASPHLLAVEGRVGRGRITMLAINPTDPSLASWPGLDTLVRRVILRRPEEADVGPRRNRRYAFPPPARQPLEGPDL